ncbi:MAG: amino acid permease [Myxococcota bacterium]
MSRAAGRIGWFLVWAVVFCDIGTSVYYVPGILYGATGDRAGFFVVSTMLAFLLLCVKEVEVTRRFPSGGGVVALADRAFGPWWGCLGGQLIMVDFFLTVAISAASGVYYVSSVAHLGGLVLPVTLVCLAILCGLNIVGIKESARVSTVLALGAFLVNLGVLGFTFANAPAEVWARFPAEFADLGNLTPWHALVGYSGAWLAFSGLESMSQIAPAMRDLGDTPRRGMIAVALSFLLTAPMLTFMSTFSLPAEVKAADSEHFISELAGIWGGHGPKLAVVVTAASLLLFAANTAIIGNYHVQVALTRREFLPAGLGALSHRFQTPYRAILLCTLVPAVVLVLSGGNMATLGGLYAFGLLGAFTLSSIGIDVLRWRDGERGLNFWIGVLTSVAVVVAFVVNLVAKPGATAFGGGLTVIGMLVAAGTRGGWWERALTKIPRMAPPLEVETQEVEFLTLEKALQRGRDEVPGILVAARGASRKLVREAADRAKARGQDQLYLLYVDEVPGLFYPQLAAPTPEGLTVIESSSQYIREAGLRPVPLWGLSHSAAATVAEYAEALGCDTVVIGATQRTFLWHALRGKFIQDLLRHLPGSIRLIVVG